MADITDTRDRSTAELLKELSDQTTALVRKEVELAKAEMSERAKRVGVGAGMLGGAGLLALFALGALTACLILALDIVVDAWLAALIVALLYGAVAGVLALVGRKGVKEGAPPVPQDAIASAKEDVAWLKARTKEARSK
jgi:uncharacterized membrane protein YqjE